MVDFLYLCRNARRMYSKLIETPKYFGLIFNFFPFLQHNPLHPTTASAELLVFNGAICNIHIRMRAPHIHIHLTWSRTWCRSLRVLLPPAPVYSVDQLPGHVGASCPLSPLTSTTRC